MATINVKNLLESYKSSINLQPGIKLPINVRQCLQSTLGLTNVSLPIGCSFGLINSTNIDYIQSCLSQYGTFTTEQIEGYIRCLNTCYVGATVYPLNATLGEYTTCCGEKIQIDIKEENVGQPFILSGCIKNNTIIPIANSNGQVGQFSAVTYGEVSCECPPPTPTPTPTVTPSFGYTPTPTVTPTITPTVTPTLTTTPTNTPTPTPTKTTIYEWIKPFPEITPTPTQTPNPSITPTPTVTPTVTPSTGIQSIACNQQISFGTTNSVPVNYEKTWVVNLGNSIGTVDVLWNPDYCPDRMIVNWNNDRVIDTGCQADPNYLPWANPKPKCNDITTAEWNVPLLWGPFIPNNPNGSQTITPSNKILRFYKSAATPSFAYITVKTPPGFTACASCSNPPVCSQQTTYSFKVGCPTGNLPLKNDSLIRLSTPQQLSCLTGDTLEPIIINEDDIVTILPNWGLNNPGGTGAYGTLRHTIYVNGGQLVPNPAGTYNIPGTPNWNPSTPYTPGGFQSPPVIGASITKVILEQNNTSASQYYPANYPNCGPNANQPFNLSYGNLHYFKPVSFKFPVAGQYDITVVTDQQYGTIKQNWHKFKKVITVQQ